MNLDHILLPHSADATPVLMVTDSLDPSGVGQHMITLAAHLGPEWAPRLAFSAGPATDRLLAKARPLGLPALAVASGKWDALLAPTPGLLHVHAGIGCEGLTLVEQGRKAGWTVLCTEHLPNLITDPRQRLDHAAMLGDLDALIAVSPSVGARWTTALTQTGTPLGVTVIRNGIAPARPRRSRAVVRRALGLTARAPLILHVGRFTAQKGQETLIDAFALVVAACPEARLMLIGSGQTRTALLDKVTQSGLSGVILADPRDDVPDLMAAADVLALPSLFEGLPLILLEAMAARLPIVASRIGGIRAAMITHVVPFAEAPAFLSHLLTDRPEFLQIVFEVPC